MITTKDRIGYIRRSVKADGTYTFKYIEGKIRSIRVGKKKTSVYADRFYSLDADELESNTEIMNGKSDLILVGEPFITSDALSERLTKVVDYWNEHGATSLLDVQYAPSKEEDHDVS